MAVAVSTGYTCSLKKGATYIGTLRNVSGPALAVGSVDMTTLYGSGTQAAPTVYKKFIAGLQDSGEVTCECLFDGADTGLSTFKTDFDARTSSTWTITLQDGTLTDTTIAATMYPNKYEVAAGGPEEPVLANIGFKVTGDITIVDGT